MVQSFTGRIKSDYGSSRSTIRLRVARAIRMNSDRLTGAAAFREQARRRLYDFGRQLRFQTPLLHDLDRYSVLPSDRVRNDGARRFHSLRLDAVKKYMAIGIHGQS